MIKNPVIPIVAGLACIAALIAMAWGMLELVEIGTCAEGGPFEIARPCPEGTDAKIWALIGGTVVYIVGLVALGASRPAAGVFMFGLLFTVLGGCFILTELDDARFGDNMGGAGWVCGPLFILLMGLPPMYAGLRGRRGDRLSRTLGGRRGPSTF